MVVQPGLCVTWSKDRFCHNAAHISGVLDQFFFLMNKVLYGKTDKVFTFYQQEYDKLIDILQKVIHTRDIQGAKVIIGN